MHASTQSWGEKLIRGLGIFTVASVLSIVFSESLIGRQLSRFTLDRLLQWGWLKELKEDDRIVLIDITDDDYRTLFHRRRPLDPKVIFELIRAAHRGGAALIGVDISTEDWGDEWTAAADTLPADARVVWARSFHYKNGKSEQLVLEDFLGGHPRAKSECYGIPAFGSAAGVVRWFYPSKDIAGERHPAFVQQMLHRLEKRSCLTEPREAPHPLIIDFAVRLHRHESASGLLRKRAEADWAALQEYAGKIVILGGSYHAGEDLHMTPIGRLSGLQLNGYALWSALAGRARHELAEGWAIAIDLVVALALMLYTTFASHPPFAIIVIAAVLFIVLSLLLWQYNLFLSFVPLAVGVVLHWWIERRIARNPQSGAAASHSISPPQPTPPSHPSSDSPGSTPAG